MILTEIGEIGIHKGGAVYKLRPSFYAISKLGTPDETVQVFAEVMSDALNQRAEGEQFALALQVLYACAEDGTPAAEIFGSMVPRTSRPALGGPWKSPTVYRKGLANPAHVLPLARSLLTHGVIGQVPEVPRNADSEPEYQTEFNARDYVAMAMAHLGVGERDAWNMTMTSLVLALRSKFPPSDKDSPGRRAPSKAEYEATMEWADKLDAVRNKNG